MEITINIPDNAIEQVEAGLRKQLNTLIRGNQLEIRKELGQLHGDAFITQTLKAVVKSAAKLNDPDLLKINEQIKSEREEANKLFDQKFPDL